mgnify:CR=1 FL=1
MSDNKLIEKEYLKHEAKILKEHKSGNYKNSIPFFEEYASKGVEAAQYNLAVANYHGFGVDINYEKAAELYKILDEKGHSTSQFALSIMYAQGNGVKQNMEEFYRLTKLSAKKGEPGAIYNLSQMYRFGDGGFSQDEKKSFKLCKEAADKGYVDAQYMTGLMYMLEKGTTFNEKEAIKYFELAAKSGHEEAKKNLKIMKEKKN